MKNINLLIGIIFVICVICGLSSSFPLYQEGSGVCYAQGITVDSNPFNITPAAPNNLTFVQQPGTTASGSAFNPVVSVRIRDIYNNNTTASNQITLSVSAGATLGGTYTNVAAVSGLATFSGVSVALTTGISGTYTLTATSTGLTQATATFNITVAPPAQVGSPSPSTGATGVPINQQLSWGAVTGATSYGVYFGTATTPPFVVTTTGLTYSPTMANSTLYYWRIDSVNDGGTTTGIIWSFTTAAAGATDVTFNYNGTTGADGSVQTWVVPTGVTSILVDCSGAQGGYGWTVGNGANGARVQTTLSVTAGNTLYIYVGGQGANSVTTAGGAGGWNGGGTGGNGNAATRGGGGGGGGSDIRTTSGVLSSRIVIAGGGGGGNLGGAGGAGGQVGTNGVTSGTTGGYGGTQAAGGAGGTGGTTNGTSGGTGTGGNGGNGGTYGGGGGGGGFYGGGAGGSGGVSTNGGGGGGSSGPTSINGTATYTPGYRAGNGQIIITY